MSPDDIKNAARCRKHVATDTCGPYNVPYIFGVRLYWGSSAGKRTYRLGKPWQDTGYSWCESDQTCILLGFELLDCTENWKEEGIHMIDLCHGNSGAFYIVLYVVLILALAIAAGMQ